MRVHVVGGFLGAGKTSAIRALALRERERGEQVAVITNDQGEALVDTALASADAQSAVFEIGGGCFCCRYDALERCLADAARAGATVAICEAVGSCTDLVATVLSPLAARGLADHGPLELMPLAVVVDPFRVIAALDEGGDIGYLYRKQIEEADVVLLSRADLAPPDVRPIVARVAPHAAIVDIAAPAPSEGRGLERWLAAEPRMLAPPLDIDYERYARAEAGLGWANGRAELLRGDGDAPCDARAAIERFFAELAQSPVAHVKVALERAGDSVAAVQLTRAGQAPRWSGALAETDNDRALTLLVNARVALPPEALRTLLERALDAAADAAGRGARATWRSLSCFAPGRPVPQHRHATRCVPGDDGACCATFYASPVVRYLLGDSLHPGGRELTLELAAQLQLPALADGGSATPARLLDVACGSEATSLRAIAEHFSVDPVGLDLALAAPRDDSAANAASDVPVALRRADAHNIPLPDDSVDALLCECALSTFADQPRALCEMRRVLRPGAHLAISDMVVRGQVPEQLAEWVHVGTCLSHARSLDGYADLLAASGFEVLRRDDRPDALRLMLRQIKRRLLGAAFARASGVLPAGLEIDVAAGRHALDEARRAIDDGALSYGSLIAVLPEPKR